MPLWKIFNHCPSISQTPRTRVAETLILARTQNERPGACRSLACISHGPAHYHVYRYLYRPKGHRAKKPLSSFEHPLPRKKFENRKMKIKASATFFPDPLVFSNNHWPQGRLSSRLPIDEVTLVDVGVCGSSARTWTSKGSGMPESCYAATSVGRVRVLALEVSDFPRLSSEAKTEQASSILFPNMCLSNIFLALSRLALSAVALPTGRTCSNPLVRKEW